MVAITATLFVAALVLLLLGPADRSLAARPNFVVIQTDDQNAATVRAKLRGQVGGFHRVMPNALRKILRQGTEFRNYYASSPVCSPSRASLLSGQFAFNSGLVSNLGPDGGWEGWQNHPIYRQNLPVTLSRAGYRTAHFGKFTNGYYDEQHNRVDRTVPPGWGRWFTTAYRPGTRFYGFELNIDGRAVGPVGNPEYRKSGPGIDPASCGVDDLRQVWPLGNCRYINDVMTAAAVREIDRNGRRPFYLQLDYHAPHGDVAPPRGPQPATRHIGTASKTRLPRPPSFNEPDFSDKPELIRSLAPDQMSDREVRRLKRSYRRYIESLRSVDDGIGAVFRALRRTRELRRTYVFLVSDHGLFLGEHRYDWGKFMPYEDSASPLMAVRGPGVRKGAVSREVVGNVDLPVTILRLAGAKPDYRVDGRSLKPFWRQPRLTTRRPMPITIDFRQPKPEASASARSPVLGYQGYRLGRYKYIRYDEGGEELYDLSRDPHELENRSDSPAYAAVLGYMRIHLQEVSNCEAAGCRAQLEAPPGP